MNCYQNKTVYVNKYNQLITLDNNVRQKNGVILIVIVTSQVRCIRKRSQSVN